MAKDDYHVIVYRLLKYLYECLKEDQLVRQEVLCAEFFAINDNYWEYIIRNLFLDGYVEGVGLATVFGKPDESIKILSNFKITPKGITYLSENSALQKVKNIAKDISPFIPF